MEIKETQYYGTAAGLNFKLVQEKDGWWSVYMKNTGDRYIPKIQAKDLEHAKSYCDMIEPVVIPMKELII
jgi:hypothetical protein